MAIGCLMSMRLILWPQIPWPDHTPYCCIQHSISATAEWSARLEPHEKLPSIAQQPADQLGDL